MKNPKTILDAIYARRKLPPIARILCILLNHRGRRLVGLNCPIEGKRRCLEPVTPEAPVPPTMKGRLLKLRALKEATRRPKNHTIHEFISKLSDDQLTENSLKPFDQEAPKSWAYYIPEITTHLAMHKMQLWMYLKLAGAPVSMRSYYGTP
jgi:hypothetical protein